MASKSIWSDEWLCNAPTFVIGEAHTHCVCMVLPELERVQGWKELLSLSLFSSAQENTIFIIFIIHVYTMCSARVT